MNKSTPEHNSSSSSSQKRLNVSFLVSLMVHYARQANNLSKKLKLKLKKSKTQTKDSSVEISDERERFRWNLITNSPLKSPRSKEFLAALKHKAMTVVGRRTTGEFKPEKAAAMGAETEEEDCVWQREILMGGKCEPLDFSGVIYYDCNGRLLKEAPPRSPRGSVLPNYPTGP